MTRGSNSCRRASRENARLRAAVARFIGGSDFGRGAHRSGPLRYRVSRIYARRDLSRAVVETRAHCSLSHCLPGLLALTRAVRFDVSSSTRLGVVLVCVQPCLAAGNLVKIDRVFGNTLPRTLFDSLFPMPGLFSFEEASLGLSRCSVFFIVA